MGNLGLQELFLLLFVFFFGFGLPFLYLNTLRKTLQLIDIKNRTIDPNYVWFMYIIFFNLFYHFHIVNSIATSLSNEFSSREINVNEKRPGETIGYVNSILVALWFLFSIIGFDFFIFYPLIFISSFVSWIVYWLKINEYKKILIADNSKKNNRNEL
jgi:hypothetical protein